MIASKLKQITPLAIDDGMVSMKDQAQMLLDHIGTEREWCSVGINDREGLAEIVLLTHPTNATLIVHCVNNFIPLLDALEELESYMDMTEHETGVIMEHGIMLARKSIAAAKEVK
jgi:hypothetical protein